MEQNTIMQELLSQVLDQQNKTNTLINCLESAINELRAEKTAAVLSEQLTQLTVSCQGLPEELKKAQSGWADISLHMAMLKEQLKQPVRQQVTHKYSLNKGFVITCSLFVMVVAQLYFLLQTNGKLDRFKANDLKYRMLKLSASPALLRILNYNDSIYLLSKDKIKQEVEMMEQEIARQSEISRIANEQEEEAKERRQNVQKGNNTKKNE